MIVYGSWCLRFESDINQIREHNICPHDNCVECKCLELLVPVCLECGRKLEYGICRVHNTL